MNMDVGMHHEKNRGNKEIPLAILSRILAQSCVTPHCSPMMQVSIHLQATMKALKCKTLGASVMYIHCTLANIHVYTCIIFIIHSIIMHTRTTA